MSIRGRWSAFGDRLDAPDPGALRRYQGARAALAALTAWLTAHLVIVWLADRPMPAVGLFAVAICFINALVIVDARRTERQWTQVLSAAISVLALLVAGLLHGSAWLYPAVLLVLIFASYVVRRPGLRPGELLLVLTMSLYFAEGSGVGWSNLAWYVFAVAIGVVSLWLWQFVLLPYDPQRSLRKGIRSLYHATAATVAAVAVALENVPAPGAGVTVGVAVALLTPDNTAFVVLFATICIFLTVYSGPLSYPRMVFWLNVGFVMVYTRLGVKAMDLLFARPVTTLLGGLVAALVVVFVFPIHAGDRFKVAAARFLGAVDGYVSAFVDTVISGEHAQPLDVAQAKVAATYAQVEQTLPGVAFENNPLLQAQSPLTQQATRIAALQAEVTRLAHAAFEDANVPHDSAAADWMRTAQALVHRDIETIIPLLRGEKGRAPTATPSGPEISARTWMLAQERLDDPSQPGGELRAQVRTSGESALIRIHRVVDQFAAELGASVEGTRHAAGSSSR